MANHINDSLQGREMRLRGQAGHQSKRHQRWLKLEKRTKRKTLDQLGFVLTSIISM